MFAMVNFEVKIPGSKSPPYQSMRATQNCWISIQYLMGYGAGFPKKVHFSKEQSIVSKTEGPQHISRFPDACWGQGLCYRVCVSKLFFSGDFITFFWNLTGATL
jgi:hypothetical protein